MSPNDIAIETTDSQEPSYTTATQIVRMIRLLQESPDGKLPIQALASALEVHPRTIKRYISAIGDAIQVENDEGESIPLIRREKKGRSPVAVYARVDSQSDDIEIAGKALSASLFDAVDPHGIGSYADRFSEEIKREAGSKADAFEKAFVYIPFGPRAKKTQNRIFSPLMNAVLNRQRMKVEYLKVGSETPMEYLIEPLCFMLYRDALYLHLQYTNADGDKVRRSFMLDRIQAVSPVPNGTFHHPKDFKIADLSEKNFGIWVKDDPKPVKVEISFHPEVAHIVRERKWPGKGVVEEGSERFGPGSVTLKMKVPTSPELLAWIASFGKRACVESPEKLREEICNHLADALEYYID